MAITVTKQNLVDGETLGVVKLHLVSGAATDVTNQSLLDVSTLNGAPAKIKIMALNTVASDMDIDLHWDATANVDIITVPTGENYFDFTRYGGLNNNAGAGVTGDILFSSRGAAADSEATIIIEYRAS